MAAHPSPHPSRIGSLEPAASCSVTQTPVAPTCAPSSAQCITPEAAAFIHTPLAMRAPAPPSWRWRWPCLQGAHSTGLVAHDWWTHAQHSSLALPEVTLSGEALPGAARRPAYAARRPGTAHKLHLDRLCNLDGSRGKVVLQAKDSIPTKSHDAKPRGMHPSPAVHARLHGCMQGPWSWC